MESGDDERCLRRQAERRLHDDVFATGQAETACPLNLLVGPEAVDFRLDLLQFSKGSRCALVGHSKVPKSRGSLSARASRASSGSRKRVCGYCYAASGCVHRRASSLKRGAARDCRGCAIVELGSVDRIRWRA